MRETEDREVALHLVEDGEEWHPRWKAGGGDRPPRWGTMVTHRAASPHAHLDVHTFCLGTVVT